MKAGCPLIPGGLHQIPRSAIMYKESRIELAVS